MATKITKFIQDVLGNRLNELSTDQLRSLRSRLKLADIHSVVNDEDVALAQSIIEASLTRTEPSIRIAAGEDYGKIKPCPQCNTAMTNVKLADSAEATYCQNCHVVVPL